MKNLPKFKNQKLFEQAFIHRSYLNEAKQKIESNERLEFLGDSILSFVVSRYLFNTYPLFNEGTLTNLRSLLVNTKSLAEKARELNFGELLKLSKGEEESKGRENESLLADSLEAFIGALFLDQGISVVDKFLLEIMLLKSHILLQKDTLKDPKSLLQEYVQAKGSGQGGKYSPVYKVLKEEGPSHAKTFSVGVYVGNVLIAKGEGKSKQSAEEIAARQALEKQTK
ncbi:MAG: ribonuclease III [bacterium]|nr:ribonuclease III [bacterium]